MSDEQKPKDSEIARSVAFLLAFENWDFASEADAIEAIIAERDKLRAEIKRLRAVRFDLRELADEELRTGEGGGVLFQVEANARAALDARPCPICNQIPDGQHGEYPCPACGIPTLHDDEENSLKDEDDA